MFEIDTLPSVSFRPVRKETSFGELVIHTMKFLIDRIVLVIVTPVVNRGHLFFLFVLLGVPLVGQFREGAAAAGIRAGAVDDKLIAGGLTWFDYDGDRVPDLYVSGGQAPGTLYRNNWDGTFTDRTTAAGLSGLIGATGVVSGDLDGDGDRELFAATLAGQPLKLYENRGGGYFRPVTDSRLPELIAYSSSATLGDYDLDGDLDIYVTNYLNGAGPEQGGQPNYLLRNDGGLHFTEVAADLAIDEAGCGLGALFTDDDGDGDPDLWLVNDYGYFVTPNELFRNGGNRTFERFGNFTRTAVGINAMGIAGGDYDGDGDLDYYLTNIRANPFFENDGDGRSYSQPLNLRNTQLEELTGWGVAFLDYDLDGKLDLAVANGHIIAGEERVEQADVLFRGTTEGTFTRQPLVEGPGGLSRGRGLVTADYDLDGDLDIAVNVVRPTAERTERALLYQNEAVRAGNWLKVELVGTTANPHGITARVTAFVGGRQYLREARGGGSYQSDAAGPLHFGLGHADRIDSLVVRWPGGQRQVFRQLPTDRYLLVRQAESTPVHVIHRIEKHCGQEAGVHVQNSATRIVYVQYRTAVPEVVAERSITLTPGSLYAGLPIHRDTVVYDTVDAPGAGDCRQLLRVTITVDGGRAEGVYPNPLIAAAKVSFTAHRTGPELLTLLDGRGRRIFQWRVVTRAGELFDQPLFLPAELPAGVYFFRIGARTQVQTLQVIRR
jgi:hypothetical protein